MTVLTTARLQDELARLERNKDRRIARDKQKGIWHDGPGESPGSPGTPAAGAGAAKSTGTTRKCANCGQVGHIKTNKKYGRTRETRETHADGTCRLCPMLNGTMSQEEGLGDSGFGSMGAPTPL